MVEHHDEMSAASGARISWKSFVDVATSRGLTDTLGRPVTERNARETWRSARAAVAKGKVKSETQPKIKAARFPSRMPATWQPQQVAFKPSAYEVPPSPLPPPPPAPLPIGEEDEATMEARCKAELDRIKAVLQEHDAKKFRFGGW